MIKIIITFQGSFMTFWGFGSLSIYDFN